MQRRSTPLFASGGFFRNCIIRKRLRIYDPSKDFTYVRHQQPIDRYSNNLRRIQDRASLNESVNFLFLIRPKPNIYDFLCIRLARFVPLYPFHYFLYSGVTRKARVCHALCSEVWTDKSKSPKSLGNSECRNPYSG